mgnify:FL=1
MFTHTNSQVDYATIICVDPIVHCFINVHGIRTIVNKHTSLMCYPSSNQSYPNMAKEIVIVSVTQSTIKY